MIEEKDKNVDKNEKSTSVVDEFNRNKRLFKKLKFKEKSMDFLWNCFLSTFKKTFKINRELEQGISFSLKTMGIYSKYEIETFDQNKKVLQIKWNNGNDKYWMKFYLRKKILSSGHIIKVTEHIYRSTPFWGLQDTAGLMWMKKNFKQEMNRMKQAIEIVIKNNGEVPDSLEPYKESKTIKMKFRLKNNTLNQSLEKYFKLKPDTLMNKESFTSKINKNSITYNIEKNNDEKLILNWKQYEDSYSLIFTVKNNTVFVNQVIKSIWDVKWKKRLRLFKKNLKELIKQLN